ncbi:hypothetical protein ACS0TY_018205 [Phlomoides rotata]
MAKRRVRKPAKKSENDTCEDGVPSNTEEEEAFNDHEVEHRSAAIRALRDVEIEQLLTTLRLLRSYLSKDQLEVPVKQFFQENLPNLCIAEKGNDGQYEVKWEDKDVNLHASLLHRFSVAYPDFSAGIPLGGFDFSNQSVKTTLLGADKLQIRSLVFDEPSDSEILQPKDGLKTPNVNNDRLSFGVTPKTLRHPRYGEMLLSVHGSPLGVYKEDNMETIEETEDG